MTYKEFLQALADAYKATQAQIEDRNAYMCILLEFHSSRTLYREEGIVLNACNIKWKEVSNHVEALRQKIYEIESSHRDTWKFWAREQFPECVTIHECRANWLQILADEA